MVAKREGAACTREETSASQGVSGARRYQVVPGGVVALAVAVCLAHPAAHAHADPAAQSATRSVGAASSAESSAAANATSSENATTAATEDATTAATENATAEATTDPATNPTGRSDEASGPPSSSRRDGPPQQRDAAGAPVSPTGATRDRALVELRTPDGHTSLELGMHLAVGISAVLDPPASGQNGLSIGNARLAFNGELVEALDYVLQLEFIADAPLLDLTLGYRASPWLRIDGGLQKVPFSGEFLLAAGNIDLVNRARVVDALAPGRQVGINVSGEVDDRRLFWTAGVFNGTAALQNDDNDLAFAARLGSRFELAGLATVVVAANAAVSDDDQTPLGFAATEIAFSGRRWLYGGDVRATAEFGFLSAEFIGASFAPRPSSELAQDETVWGFQATAGATLHPLATALVRYEDFSPGALAPRSRALILSCATGTPGDAPVYFQLAYEIPLDDLDRQQFLATMDAIF